VKTFVKRIALATALSLAGSTAMAQSTSPTTKHAPPPGGSPAARQPAHDDDFVPNSQPTAQAAVLYCVDTDATGFVWEHGKVLQRLFYQERFTVKVLSDTKRIIMRGETAKRVLVLQCS
jgi:hypothetical protein